MQGSNPFGVLASSEAGSSSQSRLLEGAEVEADVGFCSFLAVVMRLTFDPTVAAAGQDES